MPRGHFMHPESHFSRRTVLMCPPGLRRYAYESFCPARTVIPICSGEMLTPFTQGDQINIDALRLALRPLLQLLRRNPRIRNMLLRELGGTERTLTPGGSDQGYPPLQQGESLEAYGPNNWAVYRNGQIVRARIGNLTYRKETTPPGQPQRWRVTGPGHSANGDLEPGQIVRRNGRWVFERITAPTPNPDPDLLFEC